MGTEEMDRQGGRNAGSGPRRGFAVVALDQPIPRLALRKTEAAQALGMSVDFFEGHVLHELRIVRRGRLILVPIRELERWLGENQHRTLGDIA